MKNEELELFEKLEAQLEAQYPTPQSVLDAIKHDSDSLDRSMELIEIDYRTPEQEFELDLLRAQTNDISIAIDAAIIKANHLLSFVRRNIFVHEFEDTEWRMLTGVADFNKQLDSHPSTLYDQALIETLIANGIDTAKKYNDRMNAYFEMLEMQDVSKYAPVDESLEKFIGIENDDELFLEFTEQLVDEDTGELFVDEITKKPFEFERTVKIFPKGIVTKDDLREIQKSFKFDSHVKIMTALQNRLDAVIAAENYERARVLQTQLNNLK